MADLYDRRSHQDDLAKSQAARAEAHQIFQQLKSA
jgi:hypothetical protein